METYCEPFVCSAHNAKQKQNADIRTSILRMVLHISMHL